MPYMDQVKSIFVSLQTVINWILASLILLFHRVVKVPPTTGKYDVCSTMLCWKKKPMHFKEKAIDIEWKMKREDMWVRMWFPVDKVVSENMRLQKCGYFLHPKDRQFERQIFPTMETLNTGYGILKFVGKHARTNSYVGEGVPVASGEFRVILYVHGQMSYPEKSSWLIEELTSHGFIVVATYHDDTSKSYPGPLLARHVVVNSAIDFLNRINQGLISEDFAPRGECRKLEGKMKLEDGVAIIGHSFGGASVIFRSGLWNANYEIPPNLSEEEKMLWSVDKKMEAPFKISKAIALDPWLAILPLEKYMDSNSSSLLIASADEWRNYHMDLNRLTSLTSRIRPTRRDGGFTELKVLNAFHQNFTDFPLYFESLLFPNLMKRLAKWLNHKHQDTEGPFYEIGSAPGVEALKHLIQIETRFMKEDNWSQEGKLKSLENLLSDYIRDTARAEKFMSIQGKTDERKES
jgi:hypothetical protein